jgi:hypothetical protein
MYPPPFTFSIGRRSWFRYNLKYCFKLLLRLLRMDEKETASKKS